MTFAPLLPFRKKNKESETPQSRSELDAGYYNYIRRYYEIGIYENYNEAGIFIPPQDPGFRQMRDMHGILRTDPFSAILADRANELLNYLYYSRESAEFEEKVHVLYKRHSAEDDKGVADFFMQNAGAGDRDSGMAAELAIANMRSRRDLVDALDWLAERGEGSAYTVCAGLSNILILPVEEEFLATAEKLLARKNLFIEYALAALPLGRIMGVAEKLARSPDLNTKLELLMRQNYNPAIKKILDSSKDVKNALTMTKR